jgi:MFS family permease
MTVLGAAPDAEARAFDRRFVIVVGAALSYFVGLGILAPVLPRYIEDVLDGGGTEVGIAVGAFAVTAALLRPWVGRQGDLRGRRILLVGGSAVAGAATLGYGLPGGLAVLVLFRLLAGAGEAAAFIGAATTAQDLAPPGRRGQAASLFSISIYGGLSFGPVIGDWVYRHHGPGWAWVAAAAFSGLGTAIALLLPADGPAAAAAIGSSPDDAEPAVGDPRTEPGKATGLQRWLHPAGLGPGVVLALGAAGYAGFASFVPLYVDEIGIEGAGVVFFEYGILVLAVRILASRLPDVLGSRRGPALALTLQATGLLLMGLLASPAGLYGSTAIYAAGVSLLYPSLFIAVVDSAPAEERSQSIATFTLFFDLSQGLGAPLLGVVVSLTENRGAFVGASLLSAIGLVVHRRVVPAAVGPVAEVCPPAEPGA